MLDIKDLSFGYHNNALLINNINVTLLPGRVYGLLGKNGAGKSTLLKIITGLIFPNKGTCSYNGVDVSGRPVSVLENLYFVSEDLFAPAVTPLQFVAITASFYPKFDRLAFLEYLKILDVDSQQPMDKQSFGQQKKAMIAFAVATNTNLLVMDEPTNGLDIPSKIQFRKLIASVQTESRCIVISTHQVRDLDSLIDTILILHENDLAVNKTLDQLMELLDFGSYADTRGVPVLYEEESLRGKNVILKNVSGEPSKVDMELLFNAVVTGSKPLFNLLKQPKYE